MKNEKLRELLEQTVLTVLSRDGDIETTNGNFATVGADEVIRLECAVAEAFELNSDDVNESDIPMIKKRRVYKN